MEVEDIAYSKLIRPTSMRSTYWQYFGFPADYEGNILTRRNIVCNLCKVTISYNRNTTNLRAHLQAKHPDSLIQLYEPPTKKIRYIATPEKLKKEEMTSPAPCASNSFTEDTDYLIETLQDGEIFIGEDDNKFVTVEYLTSDDIIEDLGEMSNSGVTNTSSSKPYTVIAAKQGEDADKVIVSTKNYKIKYIENEDITENLLSMIIEDLLPINIAEGTGFAKFLQSFQNNIVLPSAQTIENEVTKLYEADQEQIKSSIKSVLMNNFFSLTFDKWTNHEKFDHFTISIVFANLSESPAKLNTLFINILETTTNSPDWNAQFEYLNMEKCSAVLVNFKIDEEPMLKEYFENLEIPIIMCYAKVIESAINGCFATTSVADLLCKATDFLQTNNDIIVQSSDQPPVINEHFWITKYNFFEYFIKFCSETFEPDSDQLNNLTFAIKTITECVSPLKVALDTFSAEKTPVVSLIKPLTTQLIQCHFSIAEDDSELEIELKTNILQELEQNIVTQTCLTIASFLDPRFQNLTTTDDLAEIKSELKKLHQTEDNALVDCKEEKKEFIKGGSDQKKGLSFFFGKQVAKPKRTRDRFDIEFDSYNSDVCAPLEECPITWWMECGNMYPSLRKTAQEYYCIPAVISNLQLSTEQQIILHNNRFKMDSDNNITKMLLSLNYSRTKESC